MFSKTAFTFLLVLTVSFPLLPQETAPLLPQETAPLLSQETASGLPRPDFAKMPLSEKVDIDFPGGTLADLLTHIKTANKVTPNVIVSSEASLLELPAICLRSVTLRNFFDSLQHFQTSANFMIQVRQQSEEVITVSAQFAGSRPPPKAARMSKAYDVKALLDDFAIDDIVTAIETSWKMESAKHRAELKYHKETNLLLAVGESNELNTVDNILRELHRELQITQAQQARQARTHASQEKRESFLGKDVAKLKQLVKNLETECARLNKRIAKLEGAKK